MDLKKENQINKEVEKGKKTIGEFKKFIFRGNVMDMAVGVIIGAAFGKIVTSLVSDIIMPVVGLLSGGADFTNYFVQLGSSSEKYATVADATAAGVATLNYGKFIQNIIDFLIVAVCIFFMIKIINRLVEGAKKSEILLKGGKGKSSEVVLVEEPLTKVCPFCYSEISVKAVKCPHCTSDIK